RTSTPDIFAGQAFARLLGLPPSAVTTGRAPAGGSSASAGGGPAPGTQLGVVSSPPVVRLLELMLEASDNTIAEVLARQVAIRAKTGTLPGVNALAGYVTTTSGRLLAFAVLADRVTVGIIPAEAALDRVGTALAQLS